MRPPLRLPNSIEVLRFAFSDSLSIFSYPQKAKDLPTPSGLCRRYAISIRLQPEGFEGMFWGGNSGVKLQPCWLKYPTYHYKYKMEIVSGRVKLMTDETRRVEDSPIFGGPLCSPGFTDSDLGGRLPQGWHYSCGVSKWFPLPLNPKVPIWNLDIDSLDSLPIFSTAPLPALSPFSCAIYGNGCHFH